MALLFAFPNISVAGDWEFSRLWGQSGELWDPRGRLPDFSHAGYHGGDKALPTITPTRSIKDFGAKGDGTTDDTKAFQSAVALGGAIRIPAGRYVITNIIEIKKSGTVLKGEGQGKTVLYFPKSMSDLFGYKEDSAGHSVYAFGDPSFFMPKSVSEVGIEELTIEFPKTGYPGHHKERGYNAIQFTFSTNSWVRGVTFVNFDYAVGLIVSSSNTIANVRLTGRGGHHGIRLVGSDNNYVTGFIIENTSVHDLTVQYHSERNVFANGSGVNINFDHHSSTCGSGKPCEPPHHNLFSDINLGSGSRPWASSGVYNGSYHTGPGETFWNIRKSDGSPLSRIPGFNYGGDGPIAPQVTVVGFAFSQFNKTSANEWIEGIAPTKVFPQDLYQAQLARRLGGGLAPMAVIADLEPTVWVGETVTFDGTDSFDPQGLPLALSWDFGDGTTAAGDVVTHVYTTPGTYTVTLTVDDGKLSDTDTAQLTVSAPQATCSFENLARCAMATASSQWSADYAAAQATDGQASTRWNSASGDRVGAWLALDFGVSRTVDTIVLKEAINRITGYTLQSWDGQAWSNIVAGTTIGAGKTHTFAPRTTQKIRVLITSLISGSSSVTPTLSEFEVYNEAETPPATCSFENLARCATATASSQWSADYAAAQATDGQGSTRWNSANGDTVGAWLALDFGVPRIVDTIVLTEAQQRITGYTLQSWDGQAWSNIVAGTTIGAGKTHTFAPRTTQKVRLLITSLISGPSWVTPTLSELEVYGE